ncbi:hypothetical protein IPG41_06410 [Candidatus Peregrinibacteria bacterium]|nr:MAG: hypothetical protein IPG41_06410 [Candidatus Peregrinibacteria bacterium]
MTSYLKTAIQDLYEVFSAYPKGLDIQEEWDRFAYKAMTTWGGVADFKHHLPMLFEKMATGALGADAFIVLGKLDYAQWKTWPEKEQAAIQNFLVAWNRASLEEDPFFDDWQFYAIVKKVEDLKLLLQPWAQEWTPLKLQKLTDFVWGSYYWKKEFTPEQQAAIVKWLKAQLPALEAAFFAFEKKDAALAQALSVSCQIIGAL